jgi:hypothetical protein
VVETRTLVVCSETGAFWHVGGEEPGCADATHDHLEVGVHRHLDRVALPDGTAVTAVSFDGADPYGRDVVPDFGLYLDRKWSPPWAHEHLDWSDFGVPSDVSGVVDALQSLLDRARSGQRVEVGCLGGHGRTGTALAVLAVLSGAPPDEAVAWVRTYYCNQAVETEDQFAFVAALDPPRGKH